MIIRLLVMALLTPSILFAAEAQIELMLETGGHTATIRELVFVKSKKALLSGGDDMVIREWDINTGETTRMLAGQVGVGNKGQITAFALSPDERWLAQAVFYPHQDPKLGEVRSYVRLFDYRTGMVVRLLSGQRQVIHSVRFSADSQLLIGSEALAEAPEILVWNVSDGSIMKRFRGHQGQIMAVRLDADQHRLASVSWDKTFRVWDFNTGRLLFKKKADKFRVVDLDMSHNGKYVVTTGRDRTVKLWNIENGKQIWRRKFPGAIYRVAFSSDDQYIVTGSDVDKSNPIEVRILKVKNGKTVAKRAGWDYAIGAIAVKGNRVAVSGGLDNKITLMGIPSLKRIRDIEGKGKTVSSVGISSDATMVAWGDDDRLDFSLELLTVKHRGMATPKHITNISPMERVQRQWNAYRLMDSYDSKRRFKNVLKIEKGSTTVAEIIKDVKTGNRHSAYGFNPANGQVVSGGSNGKMYAYDLKGKLRGEFIGHKGAITDLAFSADGRYLVTSSQDQTVRLWNPDSFELLVSIFYAANGEWVVWNPSGYYSSSPYGDQLFGWLVSHGPEKASEYVLASQFKHALYRPDIINTVLEQRGLKAALASLAVTEYSVEKQLSDEAGRPPKILEAGWEDGQIQLLVEDSAQKINRIKIYIDGRFIRDIESPVFLQNKITIPLDAQQNRATTARLLVTNINGNDEKYVRYTGAAIPNVVTQSVGLKKIGKLYYVSIGVNEYLRMPPRWQLENASADAIDIVEQLIRSSRDQFSEIEGLVINDEAETKPDRQAVLTAIKKLRQARPEDTVLLFLAGHGLIHDNGSYYFMPRDAQLSEDQTSFKTETAISWKVFQNALAESKGRRYFWVDTCLAENAFNPRLIKDSADNEIIVLNSTDAVTNAIDGGVLGLKNGLFSHFVIQGLKGQADTVKDGTIEIDEFSDYVTSAVENMSNGQQIPTSYRPKWLQKQVLIESTASIN